LKSSEIKKPKKFLCTDTASKLVSEVVNSAFIEEDFKVSSHTRIPATETKDTLKSRRLSPNRLSQITEKSADDHNTVNNN
jgi:hypothetical protein